MGLFSRRKNSSRAAQTAATQGLASQAPVEAPLSANSSTGRSAKKPAAAPAVLLKPGELPEYFDTLDSETQEMMRAAQKDQDDTPGETFKAFLMRSPFKLGFLATLGGLAAILLGQALGQLSAILIYIVAALFIALGLDPVVRWLGTKKISRPLAITIVFGGFTLIVLVLLAWLTPIIVKQVTQLIQTAPQYLTDIQNQPWFIQLNNTVGPVIDLDAVLQDLETFVQKPENWATFAGGLWQVGVGLANGVTAGIIVFILSLYFLSSLQLIKRSFYKMAPKTSRFRVMHITEQVTQSIGGYISGMVSLAAISAVLGFIAMTIIGVPFSSVLALVLFGLGLIPLVGPLLGWVVVVIVALFASPVTAITIGIYGLIYMQIEAYVMTPRIMNKAVSVPGSLVVIGAMAGGTLLGLLGALIAIPVTAMILIIIKQVWMPLQDKR